MQCLVDYKSNKCDTFKKNTNLIRINNTITMEIMTNWNWLTFSL